MMLCIPGFPHYNVPGMGGAQGTRARPQHSCSRLFVITATYAPGATAPDARSDDEVVPVIIEEERRSEKERHPRP